MEAQNPTPPFTPTKKFTYYTFIVELKALYEQGSTFPSNQHSANNPKFREWKLRLTELLQRVNRLGYDSFSCAVASRRFTSINESAKGRVFYQHLSDTLNELKLILDNYEKYGEPESSKAQPAAGVAPSDDGESSPSKRFTYEVFIDELRVLYRDPEGFSLQDATAQSGTFRRWKRKVEDALERVEALGYHPKLGIRTRMFDVMYSGSRDAAFLHDMTETLQEIEILVEGFDKYGSPKNPKVDGTPQVQTVKPTPFDKKQLPVAPATTGAPPEPIPALPPAPLALPQQVTWEWAKKHIPVSWFWYVAVGAISVLGVGITIGKYLDGVDKALHPEHPLVQAASPGPAPLPSAKPASK